MRTKRLVPTLAVAVALTVAGCASAANSTATASASASSPTATAHTTAASGRTHIIYYSVNSDGPTSEAILTGAVGDFGQAVSVHPNGQVDPEHNSDLSLRLTRGSFLLNGAALDQQVVNAYRHWPSNPGTCSGSITVTAATPIVAGSGTGSYRRISGTFNLTATIDEIDVKPVCNGTSAFRAQVIFIVGSGTVRIG
jgi:hypothetical protein